MSGNDLLQKLTEKNSTGLHYLVGIVDAAYASRLVFAMNLMDTDEDTRRKAEADLGKFWGCRPEKASYGQVVDVTVSYLKNHPEPYLYWSRHCVMKSRRTANPHVRRHNPHLSAMTLGDLGQFANSSFATSLVGAIAGAFAGAYVAQRVAERAKLRYELALELQRARIVQADRILTHPADSILTQDG
eukprot:gene45090-60197_t